MAHLHLVEQDSSEPDMVSDVRELFAPYACEQPTPVGGFDPERAYKSLFHAVLKSPYAWRAYTGPVPRRGDASVHLGGRHQSLSMIVHVALRGAYARWEKALGQYINRDALVAAVLHWNERHCQPPLDADEVREQVQALFDDEFAWRAEIGEVYDEKFGDM